MRRLAALLATGAALLVVGITARATAGPPSQLYQLEVELLGPDEARHRAANELLTDPDQSRVTSIEHRFVVGKTSTVQEAVAWVATEIFDGPPLGEPDEPERLRELPAPFPGGRIHETHGAHLVAMRIEGLTAEGEARTIGWPRRASEIVPEHLPWTEADLLSSRAPLFATPAPQLPPMRERHAIARRQGALYSLGRVDRCRGEGDARTCLRWVQVVARREGRFVAGYLPAYQVVPRSAWLRAGPQAFPAAQLVRSGVTGGKAQFLVVIRAPDGSTHRKRIEARMSGAQGDRFPEASLSISGRTAVVEIDGVGRIRVPLDASIDRYVRPED